MAVGLFEAFCGSSSKKGFDNFKNYLRKKENEIIRIVNPKKQGTVWDKIKRFEKLKGDQIGV